MILLCMKESLEYPIHLLRSVIQLLTQLDELCKLHCVHVCIRIIKDLLLWERRKISTQIYNRTCNNSDEVGPSLQKRRTVSALTQVSTVVVGENGQTRIVIAHHAKH